MAQVIQIAAAGAFGAMFALGLMVSGMYNPAVVTNFLDLAGNWDPRLMFVMGGAVLVAMPFFRKAQTSPNPRTLEGTSISMPNSSRIDRKLVLGAAIFGIGWGLAGICPAPAVTLVGLKVEHALYFVAAMATGMVAEGWLATF